MALVTLWFSKENEFYKALVVPELVDYMQAMGALTSAQKEKAIKDGISIKSETQKETKQAEKQKADQTEKENESINDPSKGFGKPGSLRFHRNCVQEIEDIKDIETYVKGVTGKKLSKAYKSIGAAKNAAVRIIKDYLQNASQMP